MPKADPNKTIVNAVDKLVVLNAENYKLKQEIIALRLEVKYANKTIRTLEKALTNVN